MGDVLQIRVIAQTVSPSDVGWNWRRLSLLAFGKQATGSDRDMGVLELVDALTDKFRFGDVDQELKRRLEPGVEKAASIKENLENALADWNPGKANSLSNDLEDALDALEDLTPDQASPVDSKHNFFK